MLFREAKSSGKHFQIFIPGMSYNSKQGHYSYPCTDFSSPVAVIEGDEISNAQDTTHERPTDTGLREDQDRVAKSRETPTKTLNNQI
ncbi:hypothetical protein GOBAR_DD13431 [Gossypium barbadense]|nr:hypothetical protein GOBAR_DD13431 [Gossypium barbadense]